MLGLMQNQQLLISSLIEFADRHHGEAEVVSRRVEGDIHRYTYKQVAQRSRKVANALDKLNLAFSDRVATLAWNGYRHLELYFGPRQRVACAQPVRERWTNEKLLCVTRLLCG